MPAGRTAAAQLAPLGAERSASHHWQRRRVQERNLPGGPGGWVRVGEDRYKSWWVPECRLTAFVASYSRAVVLGVITLVFWYRSHNSTPKAGTASVFFSTTYLYFSPWLHLVVCVDHVPDGIIGPFLSGASLLRGWVGYRLIRLCYRTVRET